MKLLRPSTSNPISMDATETDSWVTENQRMNQATDTTNAYKGEDYLVAGVTTSQHEKFPPNFVWPVPQSELPRRKRGEGNHNIHTEYRDNFHEWGADESQVGSLHSLRTPTSLTRSVIPFDQKIEIRLFRLEKTWRQMSSGNLNIKARLELHH